MFGFITPNKPELSEEERARYEEVYCGVCHTLGQRCGQISRATLNNDMTFVAILLMSLYEPDEVKHISVCPAHPFKKQAWCENKCVNYAADMSLVLAYFKCFDDWRDDRRIMARAGAVILRHQYERVFERCRRQCEAVELGMQNVARAEQEQTRIFGECDQPRVLREQTQAEQTRIFDGQAGDFQDHARDLNPDAVANFFGAIMSELLVMREDYWAGALRAFGAHFGRFIYMMDAAFDIDDDEKHGNYNPFLQSEFTRTEIEEVLLMYAGNMAVAFEKLPCVQDVNILRNVLYSGIWVKYNAKFRKGDNN